MHWLKDGSYVLCPHPADGKWTLYHIRFESTGHCWLLEFVASRDGTRWLPLLFHERIQLVRFVTAQSACHLSSPHFGLAVVV